MDDHNIFINCSNLEASEVYFSRQMNTWTFSGTTREQNTLQYYQAMKRHGETEVHNTWWRRPVCMIMTTWHWGKAMLCIRERISISKGWEEARMDRPSRDHLEFTGAILYDTELVTMIITHLSKPTECTTPRMKLMWISLWVGDGESTDVKNGHSGAGKVLFVGGQHVYAQGIWECSIFPLWGSGRGFQLYCECKSALNSF